MGDCVEKAKARRNGYELQVQYTEFKTENKQNVKKMKIYVKKMKINDWVDGLKMRDGKTKYQYEPIIEGVNNRPKSKYWGDDIDKTGSRRPRSRLPTQLHKGKTCKVTSDKRRQRDNTGDCGLFGEPANKAFKDQTDNVAGDLEELASEDNSGLTPAVTGVYLSNSDWDSSCQLMDWAGVVVGPATAPLATAYSHPPGVGALQRGQRQANQSTKRRKTDEDVNKVAGVPFASQGMLTSPAHGLEGLIYEGWGSLSPLQSPSPPTIEYWAAKYSIKYRIKSLFQNKGGRKALSATLEGAGSFLEEISHLQNVQTGGVDAQTMQYWTAKYSAKYNAKYN